MVNFVILFKTTVSLSWYLLLQHFLDFLFTNRPNLLSNVCVTDNLPSTDHDAIHFILNVTVSVESPLQEGAL